MLREERLGKGVRADCRVGQEFRQVFLDDRRVKPDARGSDVHAIVGEHRPVRLGLGLGRGCPQCQFAFVGHAGQSKPHVDGGNAITGRRSFIAADRAGTEPLGVISLVFEAHRIHEQHVHVGIGFPGLTHHALGVGLHCLLVALQVIGGEVDNQQVRPVPQDIVAETKDAHPRTAKAAFDRRITDCQLGNRVPTPQPLADRRRPLALGVAAAGEDRHGHRLPVPKLGCDIAETLTRLEFHGRHGLAPGSLKNR